MDLIRKKCCNSKTLEELTDEKKALEHEINVTRGVIKENEELIKHYEKLGNEMCLNSLRKQIKDYELRLNSALDALEQTTAKIIKLVGSPKKPKVTTMEVFKYKLSTVIKKKSSSTKDEKVGDSTSSDCCGSSSFVHADSAGTVKPEAENHNDSNTNGNEFEQKLAEDSQDYEETLIMVYSNPNYKNHAKYMYR